MAGSPVSCNGSGSSPSRPTAPALLHSLIHRFAPVTLWGLGVVCRDYPLPRIGIRILCFGSTLPHADHAAGLHRGRSGAFTVEFQDPQSSENQPQRAIEGSWSLRFTLA